MATESRKEDTATATFGIFAVIALALGLVLVVGMLIREMPSQRAQNKNTGAQPETVASKP